MWRIANCFYRAFRNTASHRCPQDVLGPLTTACNTDDDDDDDSKQNKNNKYSSDAKCDIDYILKQNQFSYQHVEKLQSYLKKLSLRQPAQKTNDIPSIATPKSSDPVHKAQAVPSPVKSEETLHSLLQADETCMNTLKQLSDFQEETMSMIHLQLALDALESGNLSFGIEALQKSLKHRTNAAALYNLGICYEQGVGVEQDRAKACDFYRQASALGHIDAQLNLTFLSNDLDIHDNDDEANEQTIIDSPSPSRRSFFHFSISNDYQEDQSWNESQFDLKTPTIACLS